MIQAYCIDNNIDIESLSTREIQFILQHVSRLYRSRSNVWAGDDNSALNAEILKAIKLLGKK